MSPDITIITQYAAAAAEYFHEGDLLDTLEQTISDTMGFKVTDHEVKLYGYCRDCQKIMEKEKQDGK